MKNNSLLLKFIGDNVFVAAAEEISYFKSDLLDGNVGVSGYLKLKLFWVAPDNKDHIFDMEITNKEGIKHTLYDVSLFNDKQGGKALYVKDLEPNTAYLFTGKMDKE